MMTTESRYRYSLRQQGRRLRSRCPGCGRRSLAPYLDVATGLPLAPEVVGKCDHQSSCGYHLPPRQWPGLAEAEQRNAGRRAPMVVLRRERPEHPLYTVVDMRTVRSRDPGNDRLTGWLASRLDGARVARVRERYGVTATSTGRTIYWQLDVRGRAIAGKVMDYGGDGHRRGTVTWVHALLRRRDPSVDISHRQCLFGAHLLGPDARVSEVHVVESEKTALVMASLEDEGSGRVWVATGGCSNLRGAVLAPLAGRSVVLHPDSGCEDLWRDKMVAACRMYPETRPSEWRIESLPPGTAPNTDLADLVLEKKPYRPETDKASENDKNNSNKFSRTTLNESQDAPD